MSLKLPQNGKSNISHLYSDYLPGLFLMLAWVLMQALLFYRYGLVTSFEAHKYIVEADYLLKTGTVSTPNFWLYATQILLIAGAMKLKTGFISVVIAQLLLNGLATYSFYKFSLHISNKLTAGIITLLLILNYPFQTFNTSLQTESLFCSFTILFSCYLLQLKKLTNANFIKLILFLLLICFTRPTGLLMIPCVFIYLFSRFFIYSSFIFKIGIIIFVIMIFVFILNLAMGSGGELNFILPFAEEHIICGLPTVTSYKQVSKNSLMNIFTYIINHPYQFFHLAWFRSLAFFGLFRSYFSVGHNLYLAIYFFPIYLFVIFSLKEWLKKNRGLLLFSLSLIFITWATVMLSCDDWHNRFFLAIMPFFYILSIPALKKLLQTKKQKLNSHQ